MIDELTKARVRERAGDRCEYCQLHQDDSPLASLHLEHIVPRKHGGSDRVLDMNSDDQLALRSAGAR